MWEFHRDVVSCKFYKIRRSAMKRLLVMVLLLIPVLLVSQNRPVTSGLTKVGTTTIYWVGVNIGAGEKDLALYNRSTTATDTVKFAFTSIDTLFGDATSNRRILLVTSGEIHNVSRIPRDSIWVRGTGTISYTITGVVR